MLSISRIPDILARYRTVDKAALFATDCVPLTYRQLDEHVHASIERLHTMGIRRHSRVAVVLPEGPELATAFLTVASCAICVPVNPLYTEHEFADYFVRVGATALIVQVGEAQSARIAAQRHNIPIIELVPAISNIAGLFTLTSDLVGDAALQAEGQSSGQLKVQEEVEAGDTALILTTSGTTAQPKIIALSHQILCTRAILRLPIYQITEADCLLSVMPMFHSSSLTHFLLSLVAGASVICVRGFYARHFFDWITEFQPTWCSATATMYETLLTYAPTYDPVPHMSRLRFLRAGSMALRSATRERLESVFAVPILSGYSSTETGAMAAMPLPPQQSKSGSVGLPIIDLKIVDDAGHPLPAHSSGEVIVSGPSVISGYADDADNADATHKSFSNGWFHTGDTGYLDSDGFLFLTGRIKEIINRGGEKIFPAEIENVLCSHPEVQDAVVFGIADRHLGETVGATVIRRAGSTLDEKTLRVFIGDTLAAFKVPRRIIFVAEFPRTATGKVKRHTLAQTFGLTDALAVDPDSLPDSLHPETKAVDPPAVPPITPPLTPMETAVQAIWADVLGRSPALIGRHTHFKRLGGDSLTAVRILAAVPTKLGVQVSLIDLFDMPTIKTQAEVLDNILKRGNQLRPDRWLIRLRSGEINNPPLFCLHALQGGVYMYQGLLPYLPEQQSVYGLQAMGMDGNDTPFDTVDAMVDHHLKQIRAVQPEGPYYLCGFSFGGRLALEIARRLEEEYAQSAFVMMIDDHVQMTSTKPRRTLLRALKTAQYVLFRLPVRYKRLYLTQLFQRVQIMLSRQQPLPKIDRDSGLSPEVLYIKEIHNAAARRYIPRPFNGEITYLRAAGDLVYIPLFEALNQFAKGKLVIRDVPGQHSTLMNTYISAVGEQVARWLTRVKLERAKHEKGDL